MKASLSTSITLFVAAASCVTLMACASNAKEAATMPRPQSLVSSPEPAATAWHVGQMPEDGDNILRNKMYNLFLYTLAN